MKLYTGDSPNGLKVQIALNELGLAHEIVPIDHGAGETRTADFLTLNPNAKVPVLDDGGVVVWESGAILLHLALSRGRLLPADPEPRAHALQWLMFEAANVAPTLGGGGIVGQLMRPEAERDVARIEQLQVELGRQLGVLEQALADGREHLAGEYSIADIQLFPGLSKGAKFGIVRPGNRLAAWIERVGARPAVARAIETMPRAQQIQR